MKRKFVSFVAAVGFGVACASTNASAMPANGAAISGPLQSSLSSVEKARVFCYNRYSGRFLHWGSCGGGGGYPRVYCRNRYGQFLHWGRCY